MEAMVRKLQKKCREAREAMDNWDQAQSRLLSQFGNAAAIINRLPVLREEENYGGLRCITGIKEALMAKQMETLEVIFLSFKETMARFKRAEFPVHADGYAVLITPGAPSCGYASPGISACHNNGVHLFVDAAFSEARCTYAFILLDATDSFMFARSGLCSASSALHAELIAIKEGLTFITNSCFTAITIFTDSLLAVHYLNFDASLRPWNVEFEIHCCLSLWHKEYTTIKHSPREFNMLAHNLAQACDLTKDFTEFHEIPTCLLDLI